jgi:alpha-1,2-mannosyltransferase
MPRRSMSVSGSGYSAAGPPAPAAVTRRPLMLWTIAFLSAVVMAAYMAWSAHFHQMDFEVYRMGGQHVLSKGLYSSEITVYGRHLLFTYPPIAAAFFWPLSHFAVLVGQALWDAIDVVALAALIAVSIAAARKRRVVRSDWRTALVLLFPVGFFLYPVRENLALGQINVVLVLMILADLTVGVSWRGRRLPKGLLVGLAAAVKLTPLVFIPYLAVTHQWRAARNTAITFALATGAMFVVAPRASWIYFTKDAFDVRRVGDAALAGNQTLREALARAHLPLVPADFDLVAGAVLCLGLVVAAAAYRRSSAMLGMLVCAATGLLLSPISWIHHYVWIVPALIWLLEGSDRPARGERWALAAALVFIVIQPGQAGGSGVLWYLRDSAYVFATLAFLGLVGTMLFAKNLQGERTTARVSRENSFPPPAP